MIDQAAAKPNPGRAHVPAPEPRRVRARRSRDLLGLDVNAGDCLPLDTKSANFDNIADAQALSPTLLEAYLNAAADDQPPRGRRPQGAPTIDDATPASPLRLAAPVGPRRRRAVRHARRHRRRAHVFPADGDYAFARERRRAASARSSRTSTSRSTASAWRCSTTRTASTGNAVRRRAAAAPTACAPTRSSIKAGQHKVSAAFVRRVRRPVRRPDHAARVVASRPNGIGERRHHHAAAPARLRRSLGPVEGHRHLRDAEPQAASSRCRPTSAAERARRAPRRSSRGSATRAYRRPLTAHDRDGLMPFYDDGRGGGRLRGRRPHGARRRCSRARTSSSASRRAPAERRAGARLPRQPTSTSRRACRSSSGAASPDERAARRWRRGTAVEPAALDAQVAAHARRPARRGARHALRRAVAAPAGPRQGAPRSHFCSPNFDEQLADAMTQRDASCSSTASCANDRSVLDLLHAPTTRS